MRMLTPARGAMMLMVLLLTHSANSFLLSSPHLAQHTHSAQPHKANPLRPLLSRPIGAARSARLQLAMGFDVQQQGVEYFEYDGWQCAFKRKPAAPGKEKEMPLLLVHPVGVGLGSWFWNKFVEEWEGGELFVVDLIGFGESDRWDPRERGLFVPLDWVRQLETLWKLHIQRPCLVFAQGGMSPVAIRLAARQNDLWDGSKAVAAIVLGTPQTWEMLTTGIPDEEIASSFKLLSSPLGSVAFEFFKQPFFIRFFSNTFLFQRSGADPAWLELSCKEGADSATKTPIFAFNSGMVLGRGCARELAELAQPVLVLEGAEDQRSSRRPFADNMRDCRVQQLQGNKVLPWESAQAVAEAVAGFVRAR